MFAPVSSLACLIAACFVGRSSATLSQSCNNFYDLQFDIANFDKYGHYFSDDAYLILASTGNYSGVDGIREYIKFAYNPNPAIKQVKVVAAHIFLKHSDLSTGECTFLLSSARIVQTEPAWSVVPDTTFAVASVFKIVYKPAIHKLTKVILHLDEVQQTTLISAVRSERSSRYICETMKKNCGDVWALNKLQNLDDCVNRLAELPTFNHGSSLDAPRGGGLDGACWGCRFIHAVIVAEDVSHCPHISFVPTVDRLGRVKCNFNSSYDMIPSMFFDSEDFANYHRFKENAGINVEDGIGVQDCDKFLKGIPIPRSLLCRTSDSVVVPPMDRLDSSDFGWLATFGTWSIVIIAGFGTEIIVGRMLLSDVDTVRLVELWKLAQLFFSVFLGMALMSKSYFGLLPLVIGLWKCGFPESVTYFRLAFSSSLLGRARVSALMNGVGVSIHHMATSFFIVTIITGKLLLDRDVVACTFPLLLQHLFSPMKYSSRIAYSIIEIILEDFWEWEILWHMVCVDHPWNTVVVGWTMLCAHWLFLLSVVVDVRIFALEQHGVENVVKPELRHADTIACMMDGLALAAYSHGVKSRKQPSQRSQRSTVSSGQQSFRICETQKVDDGQVFPIGDQPQKADDGQVFANCCPAA